MKLSQHHGEDADVIVVGSGPAGIAAAEAVGRANRRVLLFEAGGPYFERLSSPNMFSTHTIPEVWGPSAYKHAWVFGGGSAVNGMVCVPGDTYAYDWHPAIVPILQQLLGATSRAVTGPFAADLIHRIGSTFGFSDSIGVERLDRTGWASAALWATGTSLERRRPDDYPGWAESVSGGFIEVVTNTEIDTIDLSKPRPKVSWAGGDATATHVILACGALQTPRLLHRSGYRHVALGCYVADHPALCFRVANDQQDPASHLTESGRQAGAQVTAVGRFRSSASHPVADLQLMPIECMPDGSSAVFLALTDPRSRRSIDLVSSTAGVDGQLLAHEDDVKRLRTATRKLLRVLPDSLEVDLLNATDDDTDDWMRAQVGGYFHLSGSTRVGTPEAGIVNTYGRMHEHPSVSICDMSIVPTPPTGNPMLVAFALGQLVGQAVASY